MLIKKKSEFQSIQVQCHFTLNGCCGERHFLLESLYIYGSDKNVELSSFVVLVVANNGNMRIFMSF